VCLGTAFPPSKFPRTEKPCEAMPSFSADGSQVFLILPLGLLLGIVLGGLGTPLNVAKYEASSFYRNHFNFIIILFLYIPFVGIAIDFTPSSFARDTPTAAPRALNVPVGIIPTEEK
jgi:hypothetical protein